MSLNPAENVEPVGEMTELAAEKGEPDWTEAAARLLSVSGEIFTLGEVVVPCGEAWLCGVEGMVEG
jgi:hypothetical protein